MTKGRGDPAFRAEDHREGATAIRPEGPVQTPEPLSSTFVIPGEGALAPQTRNKAAPQRSEGDLHVSRVRDLRYERTTFRRMTTWG